MEKVIHLGSLDGHRAAFAENHRPAGVPWFPAHGDTGFCGLGADQPIEVDSTRFQQHKQGFSLLASPLDQVRKSVGLVNS